jgi:hypothetical protein
MILIAHRGNTEGPNKSRENSPEYIKEALIKGFHVEIDVWLINSHIFLGHDQPQYRVSENFLKHHKNLIFHAKSPETLHYLTKNKLHCFSHDKDECVLTSNAWIWTYPGKNLTTMSISVMPEWEEKDPKKWNIQCYGICSDYVSLINVLF